MPSARRRWDQENPKRRRAPGSPRSDACYGRIMNSRPFERFVDLGAAGSRNQACASMSAPAASGVRLIPPTAIADDVVRHGVVADEVAFIHKPFSPLALANRVREVLDSEVHVKA